MRVKGATVFYNMRSCRLLMKILTICLSTSALASFSGKMGKAEMFFQLFRKILD